jgi:hypothetical protein
MDVQIGEITSEVDVGASHGEGAPARSSHGSASSFRNVYGRVVGELVADTLADWLRSHERD